MNTFTSKITLRKAALMAGLAYILMMASPIAEFGVYHKLVDLDDANGTAKHIIANVPLLRFGIFLYLVNFIGDVIAAWAIYILLRPVSVVLSLFTAWMRIIFTILSLVAVMNLLTVVQLTSAHTYLKAFSNNEWQAQVMIALHSFRDDWSFAFIFFGLYLIMLGYLAFISTYIWKPIGICLMIAGLGWLIDSLQPMLYPDKDVNIGMLTGFGELVFMLWLFIKGTRLKDLN